MMIVLDNSAGEVEKMPATCNSRSDSASWKAAPIARPAAAA